MKKLRYNTQPSSLVPIEPTNNSFYYSPSVVSEFTFSKCSDGSVEFHNDVSLLFHSERLKSSLDADNVREWLNQVQTSLFQTSADINKGLTDDDILYFVKDKNIQGYSECREWYKHIVNDCLDGKKSLHQYISYLRSQSDSSNNADSNNSKTD